MAFCFLLFLFGFWQSVLEGLGGCSPVHVTALMRAPGIVVDHEVIENRLHLFDRLKPRSAPFDPEVLVEQGSVQPLDDTV